MPEFQINPQTIASVVRICQQLDGIPLAIELAAPRVLSLEVDQIAARLENDFRMLVGGSRTALERQRTLRATIEWSYALLSDKEQRLFRSLAVFSGGWMLPAAEVVCANEHIQQNEVLVLLTTLMNKSVILVDHNPGKETRYRLLESLRHFAAEKMSESGESEALRRRHCDWCLQFAEIVDQKMSSTEWMIWHKKLKAESENIQAAIEWSLGDNGNTEAGIRIILLLGRTYFCSYGDVDEGYQWLEKGQAILESQVVLDPLFHANILFNLAALKSYSIPVEARPLLINTITFCQEVGHTARLLQASTLSELGWLEAFNLGDFQAGLHHLNESEVIIRGFGETGKRDLAAVLSRKIFIFAQIHDQADEKVCAEEYTVLYLELGDSLYCVHKVLGDIALRQGNYAVSTWYYNQDLDLCRETEDDGGFADTTRKLAEVEKAQGRFEAALAYYRVSLKMDYDQGDRFGVGWLLACVALNQIAISRNQPPVRANASRMWAARILAYAQALFEAERAPTPMPVEIMPEYEGALVFLNEVLKPGELQSAWTEGRSMKIKQAVTYALEDIPYSLFQ